jgi:putative flippase GtrA
MQLAERREDQTTKHCKQHVASRLLRERPRASYLAELSRLILFVGVGATCAAINLALVWFFTHDRALPYVVCVTISTLISTFSSFMLNDCITFRSLVRHGHAWLYRCLRFHSAAAFGTLLTIGISTSLYHLSRLQPVTAQLIAIVVASGVNFVVHRAWTYRRVHAA